MPFRFSRRINLGNGFHLNLSKSGLGFSQKVGPVTLGSRRTTVNLPGTGASLYVNNQKKGGSANSNIAQNPQTVTPTGSAKAGLLGWLIMIISFICVMGIICGLFGNLINSTNPTPTYQGRVVQQQIFPISKITPLATDTPSPATQTDVPTPTFLPYPTTSLVDLATEIIPTLQAESTAYPTQPKRIITPTRTPKAIPPTKAPKVIHSTPVPSTGGATAICRDGTYSYSQSRSGTCSHHGGVAQWLQ